MMSTTCYSRLPVREPSELYGLGSALHQYHHYQQHYQHDRMVPMSRDGDPLLKPSAKPWSPRTRPESPASHNSFAHQAIPTPIIIPEITLQEPPKLDRPKPLYADMASKNPVYYQSCGLSVRLDVDDMSTAGGGQSSTLLGSEGSTELQRKSSGPDHLTPIEAIEAKYEHDEHDGYRRNYGGHRLEELTLSVYEDMKSFEGFARRIVALPQDAFYELQVIKYLVESKYRHYQRTLHHMIMRKIRTLVEYYMREFAHAYDHVFIGWFNHLQKYLTEDAYVKHPYMTHFNGLSFNQFIYRDLMGVIMKLRERIMTVDRHMISPIPTEFIMNSHYNTIRHMINEEQLNYVLQNLHKIYHAIQGLIDHKISY